jgi:hypothetical protein
MWADPQRRIRTRTPPLLEGCAPIWIRRRRGRLEVHDEDGYPFSLDGGIGEDETRAGTQ